MNQKTCKALRREARKVSPKGEPKRLLVQDQIVTRRGQKIASETLRNSLSSERGRYRAMKRGWKEDRT